MFWFAVVGWAVAVSAVSILVRLHSDRKVEEAHRDAMIDSLARRKRKAGVS